MNVSCPECRSVFRVDPTKIPAGGVRARCSVCGGVITIAQGAVENVNDRRAAATPAARPVPRPQPPPPRAPTPSAPTPGVAPFARNTPFGGSRVVTPPPVQGAPATPPQRPSAPTAAPPSRPSAPNVPAGARASGPAPMPPRPQPTQASSTAPTPRTVPAPSPPAAPAAPSQSRSINPFLSNDPNVKAKRLARALVSDIVAYFPQKREEGLRNGTLKQLFREEIKKSYEEYVEQMGKEFAETTTHFQEALNEVLAGGKKLF
jgi:predicted Zn finger-like uncharacterized protein